VAGNRFLVENGQAIHYLTTERDAVPLERAGTGRGLLAVGGAAFDDRPFSPRGDIARRTGCEVGVAPLQFENLPMALKEAQDVAGIWATVHNRPGEVGMSSDTRILSGRTATKQAVTTTMKGRQVVHLSTHGFFLDSRCTKRGSSAVSASTMEREAAFEASHPLLLSGLAFAGANRAGNTPAADGILTAEEVAALNLQGTEWVVLSACDTGIGEIRVGEGVFGLRRAFQIAGVRTIIMSLWSVEDEATRVWMRALYDARLRRGASTDRSMTEASVRVLNARRSRGESTHPFYWAAFVAAGDWR
jgi:CHAT domain-containing protein